MSRTPTPSRTPSPPRTPESARTPTGSPERESDYNKKQKTVRHSSKHDVAKTKHGKKTYDSYHYEKSSSSSTQGKERSSDTRSSTFIYNESWRDDPNSQSSSRSRSDSNSSQSSSEMPIYKKYRRDTDYFKKG